LPFSFGKGSKAALQGASREQGGAAREQRGNSREQEGALWGSAGAQHKEPELAASCPAIAAKVISTTFATTKNAQQTHADMRLGMTATYHTASKIRKLLEPGNVRQRSAVVSEEVPRADG
jgi:hypothetical protein